MIFDQENEFNYKPTQKIGKIIPKYYYFILINQIKLNFIIELLPHENIMTLEIGSKTTLSNIMSFMLISLCYFF